MILSCLPKPPLRRKNSDEVRRADLSRAVKRGAAGHPVLAALELDRKGVTFALGKGYVTSSTENRVQ